MKNFQVAIIGGGVIGSALAWELSKYTLNVAVFEQGSDVASGTSKANSGVLHSGINSPPTSLKARFCVEGNQMFPTIAKHLGIAVNMIGKYVIAKNDSEIKELERLQNIGRKNKIQDLKIINGKQLHQKEPHVSCVAALWVPTAGILLPYQLTIAFAETAAHNNVHFFLNSPVTQLKKHNQTFKIHTSQTDYTADIIVNATGLDSRTIYSYLEPPDFHIYPCRGEYLVLDKNCSNLVTSMIYPVPDKKLGVLGVHITPTIEGNILLGPSAEYIDDPHDTATTKQMMQQLLKESQEIIPTLHQNMIINAYAGIRCKLTSPTHGGWADYRIEESKNTPGFINLLGIESPGLTAAPAIARHVATMIFQTIKTKKKTRFKPYPRPQKRFAELTKQEQDRLIQNDSRWGRIICRCEHITEKEVIDALSNPLGARTLAAVKYRCRAGMGRCQGGFCTQHIIRILQEQFHQKIPDMNLSSPQSTLFTGRTRGGKK